MFRECECGNMVNTEECQKCGRIYDVVISYNEEKTLKSIKRFIIDNSSVVSFSEYWKYYYDWDGAGEGTIQAYLNDINSHKKQVDKFLDSFKDKELFEMREKIIKEKKHDIADEILRTMGYVFTKS